MAIQILKHFKRLSEMSNRRMLKLKFRIFLGGNCLWELVPTRCFQKYLCKDHSNGIGLLKKPNGKYNNSHKENIGILHRNNLLFGK